MVGLEEENFGKVVHLVVITTLLNPKTGTGGTGKLDKLELSCPPGADFGILFCCWPRSKDKSKLGRFPCSPWSPATVSPW